MTIEEQEWHKRLAEFEFLATEIVKFFDQRGSSFDALWLRDKAEALLAASCAPPQMKNLPITAEEFDRRKALQ
jgi:hypothetical protein